MGVLFRCYKLYIESFIQFNFINSIIFAIVPLCLCTFLNKMGCILTIALREVYRLQSVRRHGFESHRCQRRCYGTAVV